MKVRKKILLAIVSACLTVAAFPTTSFAVSYTATRYDCSGGVCVKKTTTAPSPSSNGVNYTPVSASAQEKALLQMVNAERTRYGLKPYTLNASLSGVARVKSTDMINNRYFAHQSPRLGSVRDMLSAAKISYRGANENIARYGSLQKAFAGLMSSPGHRNNLLSKVYTQIGLAVVQDASGVFYITQIFISK